MLPGVKVFEIKKNLDERGFFAEVFRDDWKDLIQEDRIVQTNLSYSYPGIIRAWHRHARGQVDYFVVINGILRICAYDDSPESPTRGQLDEIISYSEKPQVVRIPGHYWHGIQNVGKEPSLTLYFVNTLYDYKNPDEQRRPHDDPAIIDPRTGKPYDWNNIPNR